MLNDTNSSETGTVQRGKVRDYMTLHPTTLEASERIPDAVKKLERGGFRHLPVLERGVLIGMVSDRDLRAALPSDATTLSRWEMGELVAGVEVRSIMTHPLETITTDATLEQAARRLHTLSIGALAVVDESGRLEGIISVQDLLRSIFAPVEGLG